jgi:hypothetical protein
LVENVCVLIDFVYENDVGRVWAKKFSWLKKERTRTLTMISVLRKKVNAHGREKVAWCVEINFKWRTNIRSKVKCLPCFEIFGEASSVYPIFPFFTGTKNVLLFFVFWVIFKHEVKN